ncbi:MAG: HD domain-containing protein [Candidatus Melainabacteria bacterium]|uniref:HD domain-containing protein n=1 Tax=Candidatus Obscuribacter phosphatis TaxID=1906157 RepID=A0A8J7TM41_9BACT|nr:HD domain-containing protein [Candidatus Obscuribacter phosphatis]MCA0315828.1 HD domain-containing protein [Candidatus Melainabacteria bacterium]OPZ83253.1 MAG: deoxyguanosinetriphosphate triphosphohydrolase-like protein [bacterium ADurb.Bin425]
MPRVANKRTYLDPIHQDIVLDRDKPAERLVVDLIDAVEFQRLRRIHQLGVSYFTFQGAEGSRFTHSVGVMHVAHRLCDILASRQPQAESQRALILASALLHDVGHGPFSHVTEKILGYDHEDWSCKVISGDTQVREILDNFKEEPGLADKIVKVLKKTYTPHYVSHIVSSQLDCDRFDYLLRDSYMTGTAYGLFALKRILRSMEIDDDEDRLLVVGEKGQIAVEDYLFARYSMYAQVYYHRKNLAARAMLGKLIKRARYVLEDKDTKISFIDEPTRLWLTGEHLTVDDYLSLDDVQFFYHIKRWLKDNDPILADLSYRFLNRKIFKASRIKSTDKAEIDSIEAQARKAVASIGYDPDYYVAVESTGFRPYDYYRPEEEHPQTNIMVRTESGEVKELSQLSLAIEALVKGNYESSWLVYPQEASEKILEIKEPALTHSRV